MAEVTVSQPGLGIRFPTFRKHAVMVDKVVTGIQLLFERASLLETKWSSAKGREMSESWGTPVSGSSFKLVLDILCCNIHGVFCCHIF